MATKKYLETVSATALAERPTEAPEVETRSSRSQGTGRRLTQREVATLMQLSEMGKNIPEIAQVLDCSVSTVHRTLEQWQDKRSLARKYLEANAPKLAKTVVRSKDAATALRTLGKLDVVREDGPNHSANVVIAIGQPGQSLAPPTISITQVPSIEALSPPSDV